VTRPTKIFKFDFTFTLSRDECKSLRLNAVGCLFATCNVPDIIFNFAFPAYSGAPEE
jgi:hypothetical protein